MFHQSASLSRDCTSVLHKRKSVQRFFCSFILWLYVKGLYAITTKGPQPPSPIAYSVIGYCTFSIPLYPLSSLPLTLFYHSVTCVIPLPGRHPASITPQPPAPTLPAPQTHLNRRPKEKPHYTILPTTTTTIPFTTQHNIHSFTFTFTTLIP
jgi:hypothetical protein